MQVPLYELILDDCTRYYGGDIQSPKWRESPDKAIAMLKLRLPSGDYLLLSGYDEYNFFIEAVQNLYGNRFGGTTYIYVMGTRREEVTSYRIALGAVGQSIGDMTVRKFPKGQENDGKPTTGWHRGNTEVLNVN